MFKAPSKEEIETIKTEFGEENVRVLDADGLTFVCALPVSDTDVGALYKRFRELFEDEKKESACVGLFKSVVRYPQGPDLERVVARRPGIPRSVGMRCASELLGIVPVEAKKD